MRWAGELDELLIWPAGGLFKTESCMQQTSATSTALFPWLERQTHRVADREMLRDGHSATPKRQLLKSISLEVSPHLILRKYSFILTSL